MVFLVKRDQSVSEVCLEHRDHKVNSIFFSTKCYIILIKYANDVFIKSMLFSKILRKSQRVPRKIFCGSKYYFNKDRRKMNLEISLILSWKYSFSQTLFSKKKNNTDTNPSKGELLTMDLPLITFLYR